MKPMLAEEGMLGNFKYPTIGSFKLNGVRGLVIDCVAQPRSLKQLPNKYTRQLFSKTQLDGFDGEFVVGPFGAKDVFTKSTSGVMSHEGKPDVRLYVFDYFKNPKDIFKVRIDELPHRIQAAKDATGGRVVLVEHRVLHNDKELLAMEAEALALGYEGLVLRDPLGTYKFGRATPTSGDFLRYTPWMRSEAIIMEVLEGETNTNPQTKNELGYAKRSSHKAGKVKTGTAGAILVRDIKTNVEFKMPLGTDKECAWFWKNRQNVVYKIMKYKFKSPVKTAPRFPQPEGFRSPLDMSD